MENETLKDILERLAIAQGHMKPPEDFVRVRPGSYFTTLKEYYEPETNRRMMDVRCVCGEELTLPYRTVTQCYKTSCGCKDPDLEQEINTFRSYVKKLPRRMEDLRTSGLHGDGVHGFLKVVDFEKKGEKTYWIIDCVCGTKLRITRRQLISKQTDTCGDRQCVALRSQGYTRDQAHKMFVVAAKAQNDPTKVALVRIKTHGRAKKPRSSKA